MSTLRVIKSFDKTIANAIVRSSTSSYNVVRRINTTHQENQSTVANTKLDEEYEAFTPISNPIKKGPKRPPFVKNLFLGKFDKEILAFPEVLEKDRHETLHDMLEPIERYFDTIDGDAIDRNAKIPQETLDGLKELGLYGMQVPEEYGGLGLGATEYARINEIIAMDASIGVTLAAHQSIGLKGILICGTDAQKEKYLPRLASGEWTAAFALSEPTSGSDAASIQTRADLQPDGSYLLNGNKIWISNGGYADFMTVFAQTKITNHLGESKDKITAFLVERNFGGISSGNPEDKLGIRGSNTTQVYFENVPVPAENVLGEVGGGFKVAMNILNSGRFSMGSAGAGMLKKLMEWNVEYALNRKQFKRSISEFGLIKEKIGLMAMDIYAMESMAYLTAGMIDSQEDADCSVEAAIVKVFSSEACWRWTSEALQVLGGLGFTKDYPYERYLRDSRILLIFEGTNEILRMFIGLSGCQHAGIGLYEMVKKFRNPMANPGFVTKKFFEQLRKQNFAPKLDLDLKGSLHPSLSSLANDLELCVKKYEMAIQELLKHLGKDVGEPANQKWVARSADAAISLYAMTAVLSRASRSYCIGLENCDHEMHIVSYFCHVHKEKVLKLCEEMTNVAANKDDKILNTVADKIFENNGYAASHPLLRTFW